MTTPDVAVVGGGLIGLGIAWRAAQRGLHVTLVDPEPGRGASWVAAGMLAPVTEAHYGEEALLRLNLDSAARYAAFVADLEAASGLPAGYRETGTLAVALDTDDRAVLADLAAFQHRLGLDSTELTGRECRRLEPLLAPGVRGGILVAGDHSVDNRLLVAALLAGCDRAGVALRRERVAAVTVRADQVSGVRTEAGEAIPAATVVLAAGAWAAAVEGLPPGVVPPVRPVKGQVVRLRVPPAYRPFLSRVVRGTVRGSGVYLVPRTSGELVVGATVEEQGYDTSVTAGGVYELLRDAHELVPGLTELGFAEVVAGLRPGSPDNAPMLGPSALPGLVLAAGHYRNGVLLTPVTADALAEYLAEGTLPPVAMPFTPARFHAGVGRTAQVPA